MVYQASTSASNWAAISSPQPYFPQKTQKGHRFSPSTWHYPWLHPVILPVPERVAAAEVWPDASKYPAGRQTLLFKCFIVIRHFNMLLCEHLNQSMEFSFPRGKSINNIILGKRVEVLVTKSVSYVCRSCQENKVRGCICRVWELSAVRSGQMLDVLIA